MNIKAFLKKLIEARQQKEKDLRAAIEASQSADEVRSLGETLKAVLAELEEAKKQLEEEEKKEDEGNKGDNGDNGDNTDNGDNEGRSFNPLAAFGAKKEGRNMTDKFSTLEYRKAFMNFVQNGVAIPAEFSEARAGYVSSDVTAVIPTTIQNEVIKGAKIYGQLYNKVRHLNVKGGVQFPISTLKAKFNWVASETSASASKTGDMKKSVTFTGFLGEIKVTESIVAQYMSLDLFEEEITTLLLEGFLEAMDKGIVAGTGLGQMTGITKDSRITNVVEMTAADMANWEAWKKKLFAKIPLAKRGQGEFIMAASTAETYITSMKDKNDRPLFKEAADGELGSTAGKFFGRTLEMVEPDVVADFDTASKGDVVAIYWNPKDYAINSNMNFTMKTYTDENTNEKVHKALVIADGKILDPAGCFIIKKAEAA